MKIIKHDEKLKEHETEQAIKNITKEQERYRVLINFRKSEAFEYIMEILNKEIDKAADVRTIPSDARNLTETAKLLIINQRALVVLENIKKRIKG